MGSPDVKRVGGASVIRTLGAKSDAVDSGTGSAIVEFTRLEALGIESSTSCVEGVGVDVASSFGSGCGGCMSIDCLESMLDLGLAG